MTVSLQATHTFALPVSTDKLITISSIEEMVFAWQQEQAAKRPVLILGEGSNTLFIEDFAGTVLLNRIKGYQIEENEQEWRLHIGAGENWHQLVEYTVTHNMGGLENLALIPGTVGSAPIQNIGAYGIEFKQFCSYVDIVNLATGTCERITDCQFGYRDSIFKHQYCDGYAIIAVGIKLPKHYQLSTEYGDLRELDTKTVTAKQVFDKVCEVRRKKLPDPKVTGNAGSFFKNPVLPVKQAQQILQKYPNAPHYPQADGTIKFAAGWLIDQCNLKGYQMGGAAVHQNQALVLINCGNATHHDVVNLAKYVREKVADKFTIWLEPEVRFITATGEKDAIAILQS